MKKNRKRIVAAFMTVLMALTLVPTWLLGGALATTAKADDATFEGGKEITEGAWKGWTWSVFGNSVLNGDKTDNSIKVNDDDSITLNSANSKGGKIDAKNNGVNYFYKKLTMDSDFTITTTATISQMPVDKQYAFGLAVMAKVGTHEKTSQPSQDEQGVTLVGGYDSTAKTAESSSLANVMIKNNKGKGDRKYPFKINDNSANNPISGEKTDIEAMKMGSTYDLCIEKIGDTLSYYENGCKLATADIKDILAKGSQEYYVGVIATRCAVTYTNTNIKVIDNKLTASITTPVVVQQPAKGTYCQGNTYSDIDMTGLKLKSGEEEISYNDCKIVGYNFSTVGTGTITLDYFGKQFDVSVNVIREVVDSVNIEYMPIKTDYMTTDTELDFNGLVGTVIYNSGVKKDLKKLIDDKDSETTVSSVDFTSAGEKSVEIAHTHGDVTKTTIIPIKVSDAQVTGITITNPNITRFYTDTTYNADDYVKGVTITISYSDGSTKVISGEADVKTYVSPKSTALDTTVAGEYTYVVNYNGKTAEYSLEVVNPTATGLVVEKYPDTTTYVKGTAFDKTGIEVAAVYDSGKTKTVANPKVDASSYDKDTVGTYDINISANVEGKVLSTTIKVSVKDKTEYSYADRTWKSVIFGQSVNVKASDEKPTIMTIDTSEAGKVKIDAPEGLGKCTDDGQDGIAFYYTELSTKENFEISAKVTVDYFITKPAPDAQEGFGITIRDSIGTNGDSSIYNSNAISVGGYYGQYNVFGRYGVKDTEDASGKVNVTKFGKLTKDLKKGSETIGKLTYQIKKDSPKTFTLKLKKDNSGIYAWMQDESGAYVQGYEIKADVVGNKEELENVFYYLPADTFSSIKAEKMYLGFFAARGAGITVDTSSIDLKITDSVADAPQTFAPEEAVVPAVSQESLSETSSERFTYKVNVNTKGLITLKKDGKTIVNQQMVEKGTYDFDTTLTVGANKFQVYFEPDATQNITSSTPIIMNSTVTRRIIGPDKEPIYCSPDGSLDAAGTKESPVDLQTAITYCQAGQPIYVLGGTYNLKSTTGVWHGNDGTGENGMKYLMAAPDNTEDVIFDFGGDFKANKFISNTFDLSGDYWYVSDIKFANGGGVRLGGNHCIIERCDFYGHSNSGLSISRTDSATNKADWPSYNQIIDCNSYNNSDKSQNNADGFAAKLTCGEGNVFKGCIAAYNADDGWDLFSKTGTGAIGEVEIYDSVCYANGFLFYDNKLEKSKGDGNGFKMGGSGVAVNHKVYNSYSFGNKTNGFTNNSDPLGEYINCVGYNNGGSNLELHVYTGVTPQFKVENFKSYADDTYKNIANLGKTLKESKDDVISTLVSENNFFINKDGKSVNSKGVELTNSNWKSLEKFAEIINGGVKAIPRDDSGKIVLGDFLQVILPENKNNNQDIEKPDTGKTDTGKTDAGSDISDDKISSADGSSSESNISQDTGAESTTSDGAVTTGDSANAVAPVVIMLVCILVATGTVVYQRKRKMINR